MLDKALEYLWLKVYESGTLFIIHYSAKVEQSDVSILALCSRPTC